MVGLVLVSHSRKLAESVRAMVVQMTTADFPVAIASGAGDDHSDIGTDAVHIAGVLQTMNRSDGLLVLMDLGSAVLSAQTALELVESSLADRVLLCAAPLVEGAIAAAVQAYIGGTLDEVAREAQRGLVPKQQQLQAEISATLPIDPPVTTTDETSELILTVRNEHGLHARPAAAFVRTISKFSSSIEIANLTSGRGPVPARSLTSVALLQIGRGDRIRLTASGADWQAAFRAIREMAADDFGERSFKLEEVQKPLQATRHKTPHGPNGIPGSEGIAIGPLQLLRYTQPLTEDCPAGSAGFELAKLTSAMKAVREEISLKRPGATAPGDILEAQAMILTDPIWLENVKALLEEKRLTAAQAWIEKTEELAANYRAMNDLYLRERAADIRDLQRRVLQKMQGVEWPATTVAANPCILFTEELLPSEAAACDAAKVLGVITQTGSATSHSAIILRTLGIPMVVGVSGIDVNSMFCKIIAMDGATGEIWIEPDRATITMLEDRRRAQEKRTHLAFTGRLHPCVLMDGAQIEVLANVGSRQDAIAAAENGAEGVGLLRTEVLFLSHTQAPTEEEQIRVLSEVYKAISGPITVRTFDVGADKPLRFMPQPEERNPYLGVRGIRLSLKYPELFVTHLRAILSASVHRDLWLMFPMIATLQEAQDALRLLDRAHRELEDAKRPHAWPVKRGAMIEVPSAALISTHLADHLDFFSVGTNDLTQYAMAAERGSSAVAGLQDALHPAILRLIKFVLDGARGTNRHVSVCGDAASDPIAAAVFIGLGIRSLSVRPNQAAAIKAALRGFSLAQLKTVAEESLQCREASEVRALASEAVTTVSTTSQKSKPHLHQE